MKIATPKEMANIDRRTIEDFGLPSIVLMENASKGIYDTLLERMGDLSLFNILVICGRGNNGGDGIALARHLHNAGISVKVALLCRKRDLRNDPKIQLKVALSSGVNIEEIHEKRDLKKLKGDLEVSDLVVDGIFGTGFVASPIRKSRKGKIPDEAGSTGTMEIPYRAIDLINQSEVPVLSIDLPSGLNGENGLVEGPCVQAALTATLGLPKPGLLFSPGREHSGKIEVIDIGIPEQAIDQEEIHLSMIEKYEMSELLPQRFADSHKGTYGMLLCISGSVGMTGAATLTALSALRSGCGLVTLGIPESLNDIVEEKVTEVITKPLPETDERTFALEALEDILSLLKNADVLAIGPGLSTHQETRALLRRVIERVTIPTVIDADGLNNLSFDSTPLKNPKGNFILTPHPGELSRLIDLPVEDIKKNRIEVARTSSRDFRAVLVLKDSPTLIADPSGEVFINPTGNSGLATGGSGDVLTGMIAGFLAQGSTSLNAARLGAYLHGLAGDIAMEEKTEYGLIASDILETIPKAIKAITNDE
jgi:NAD(P)H-hydrate epimerase